ncbi:MAG: isoleucine--tRNA ligase, partial [Planctomycetota bacterium]
DDGTFKEEVTPWKGRFVKDCDKEITKDLKKRGHLIKSGVYEHEYPFCWRCDTPLLYFARPAWFIRTTEVIQKIIKLNEKINWIPEHIKHGRFGRFLENNRDWALSRERFWGTPLPIWICENPKCKNELVIGSIQELVSQKGYKGPKSPEPHKPYIDEVSFECEKCGKNMRRVPEVIDCWFDSGSMPFAQWGYPHQNQDKFKRFFPADFISEAMDQTRGWFYTLLMINGILFEKSPYQNCLVLGLILGEDGKKMSKRLGNYVEPTQMLEEVGADAMRWYFYSTAPTWTSIRFFPQAVKEAQKDFHIKIWNCYSFFTIYANLDEYNPQKKSMKVAWKNRSELDQWILSEFQNMVEEVRENLDKYHIFPAAQAILRFVDGLSNWYIRRSRNRFWKSEKDQDKWAAYSTLYEVLVGLSKVIAPFVPFLAEEIYQNLVVKIQKDAPESVHLCDYPKVDNSKRDMELVKKMALVREIVTLGHNSRMQEKIKVRQPLPKVLIVLADPEIQKDIEPFRDLILEELNVKDLEFLPKASEYVHYRFKPNFKILGPKYGKEMGAIQKALAKASGPKAYQELKEKGKLKLQINQKTILLDKEEVLVELVSKEGFTAADGRGVVVILDVRLTEDLILEGMARDLVNRIQKLRKKAELQYDDRIHTRLYCEKKVLESAKKFQDYIQKETLTKQLDFEDAPFEGQESFQMEGTKVILEIQKIKNVNAGAKKNTEKG